MHRIDGAGVAAGGLFREGNPGTGTRATTVTADWANAMQLELIAVIEAAGINLNKADNTQLRQAVQMLVNGVSVPVGTVIEGYWPAAPAGYLLLKGDVISRTGVYAPLWAHVSANGLVVTDAAWLAGEKGFFSSGNGTTTFRLPDIRAEFARAWDNGRGIDAARALGSLQLSENKAHDHTGTTAAEGDHNHANGAFDKVGRAPYVGSLTGSDTLNSGTEAPVGVGDFVSMLDAGGHDHTFTTDTTGGTEARPRNVALNKAIKY